MTASVQRDTPSGLAWPPPPPPPSTKDVEGWAAAASPSLGQPRPQERARRGGHTGVALGPKRAGGLVRVGRAQVELEAALAGRAGLEGQLELARHAHAVGRHDREPP